MTKISPMIVWFRQDLRLSDQPALTYACKTGKPIIPLYILDESLPKKWKMGGASRWWLHNSLAALDESLRKKGGQLLLLAGDPLKILPALVHKHQASEVVWNRCYEPYAIERDDKLEKLLPSTKSFSASLLFEPEEILNQKHEFFKVYTPFWKRCIELSGSIMPPLAAPQKISFQKLAGQSLDSFALLPHHPDWSGGLKKTWKVGENAAQTRLKEFIRTDLEAYAKERDRPDLDRTSRLSPYLHFGEISPREVYHKIKDCKNRSSFFSEIGWREFSYYQLYHYPKLPDSPWRAEFERFTWLKSPSALRKWQRGETGFPIVDAGMRQLWETGWMHNRVRMIVASFLIKDLLLHWKEGEKWFWDTLVDADLANNAANWQWVAGCGFDSAPFFRIFNPTLQGEKFDPEGTYVKRWIPELKHIPSSMIHCPLAYDPSLPYPSPIVNHREAYRRALDVFKKIRN